jgi:glycosyltransferase involved in cell wall biosynthesis
VTTRPTTVTAVLPCKDEALNLPAVLPQMPALVTEVVVVVDRDDRDGTADVAKELRPDVHVVHAERPGKGHALRAGFEAATGDVIVAIDGDGSNSPREIEAMVDALAGGARLVKGSRHLPGGSSSDATALRRAGNAALCRLFNRLHGTSHTDLCYGFFAFWAVDLPTVLPAGGGFEVEVLVNANASRAGLAVVEVPSQEGRRIYGESNLRPLRDGLTIFRTLLRER